MAHGAESLDSESLTQLLLIGSEPEMMELLEEILSDSGFEVRAESDTTKIEDLLADPTFDLVLCDEMTGELDGLMIFDALVGSALNRRPSFILLSDDPDGERIARCLERDMEEYIVKPFDIFELVARIKRVTRMAEQLASPFLDAHSIEIPVGDMAAALDSDVLDEGLSGEQVGFAGDLEYLNLPDLLMNLHQNGRTGTLHVDVDDGEYIFYFNRGELLRTDGPRGLRNRKAFYRAMREEAGKFRYVVLDEVDGKRSSAFENVANAILQAVQEADEYPLTRRKLPSDPVSVALTPKVEETTLPENSAIQPLLEGLLQSTTIDILIHACPKTDLEAAKELEELMMAEVLIQSDDSAAAAS